MTSAPISSTPDRLTAPGFHEIDRIDFPAPTAIQLDNGIPAWTIDAGSQDVVKIELQFDAGAWFQSHPLVASAANALVNGGTADKTADELAEHFDFYGAYIQLEANHDHASVSLFTLNKYLPDTLPLFETMLKHAQLPQSEFDLWRTNAKQEFEVSNEQVGVRGQRAFRELIYGADHPYGRQATAAHFDTVSIEDVRTFYHERYASNHCKIIAAGKIPAQLPELLNHHFGQTDWSRSETAELKIAEVATTTCQFHTIEKNDALQASLRIGRRMFTRSHKDFQSMQVLSTILGGYFGSRLMTNIREDKGYTYGIGSAISSNQHDGMFFVTTQVGSDVAADALKEIYIEIDRLRKETISEDELDLVRNYLLGSLLKSIDGPFSLADRWKSVINFGMDFNYYNDFVHVIKTITATELKVLANRWLAEEDLIQLVVGKQN